MLAGLNEGVTGRLAFALWFFCAACWLPFLLCAWRVFFIYPRWLAGLNEGVTGRLAFALIFLCCVLFAFSLLCAWRVFLFNPAHAALG